MSLLATLRSDIARQHAFNRGDKPALATTGDMLAAIGSPRFAPVLLCRLAHWCAKHRLRPVGKAFSLANFVIFGLEIGLDCEIGPGLYFPHTSGTVIGARKIGANAVIYHNVTIGAKVPDLAWGEELRPELGDNVFVGAGAKVLGSITLEDGVVVGANAVVVHSVQRDHLVTGIPGKATPRKRATSGSGA